MKSRRLAPVLLAVLGCATSAPSPQTPPMEPFGTTQEGVPVHLFTLTNANGLVAKLTNFGATLVELHVPDREGDLADIVLGFDDVAGYEGADNQYFGCIAGRVANRVAKGSFELDGARYQLATNDGPNHLHGGEVGFGRRVWQAQPLGAQGVRFTYVSPAGEEGYPGRVNVSVTYQLNDRDELILEYEATCDAPTPINLTSHSYFNLAGHGAPTVLDHVLQVDAAGYTPTDATLIPTGELAAVEGTVFDFRAPRVIGERVGTLDDSPALGYDHNFVLDRSSDGLGRACRLFHPGSGRVLEVWTTEPGLQVYCGNFLFGQTGKDGRVYAHRSGLCLEAQHFPDSINQPGFPRAVLRPGQTYTQRTLLRFSTESSHDL
jgi:aldose 1-epimerase